MMFADLNLRHSRRGLDLTLIVAIIAFGSHFCTAQTIESIPLSEPPLKMTSVDSDGDGSQEVVVGTALNVMVLSDSPTGLSEVACFPHGLTTTHQLVATKPDCAYIFVADGVSGISAHQIDNFVETAVGCPDAALVGAKSLASAVAMGDRTAIAGAGEFAGTTSTISTRLVALDCMTGGPDDGCGGSLPGLDGETDFVDEPLSISFTDVDLDGDLDLAALFESSQSVRFGLTSGQDDFLGLEVSTTSSVTVTCTPQTPINLCSPGELTLHADPIEFLICDLDGDGLEDVAAICAEGQGTLSLFRKLGSSHFEGRFGIPVGGAADQIAALDLDADGDLDLATASDTTVWTVTHSTPFAFSTPTPVHFTAGIITDLAAVDIDGDGCAELLVSEINPSRLVVISFGGAPRLIRGDVNQDGSLGIIDAILILTHLFVGPIGSLDCEDAADASDDEVLGMVDPILLLGYLFVGGAPLPAPWPACGCDPTGPLGLGCSAPSCP